MPTFKSGKTLGILIIFMAIIWGGYDIFFNFAIPHKVKAFNGREVKYIMYETEKGARNKKLPMIICLHGYGDKPKNAYRTFKRLSFNSLKYPVRIIIIHAFHNNGNSWYNIKTEDKHKSIDETGKILINVINKLRKKYNTAGKPVIFGFSQGAIMAYYIAATAPNIISSVVAISGKAPIPETYDISFAKNKPVVICFNNTMDPIVPYFSSLQFTTRLSNNGYKVIRITNDDTSHWPSYKKWIEINHEINNVLKNEISTN